MDHPEGLEYILIESAFCEGCKGDIRSGHVNTRLRRVAVRKHTVLLLDEQLLWAGHFVLFILYCKPPQAVVRDERFCEICQYWLDLQIP